MGSLKWARAAPGAPGQELSEQVSSLLARMAFHHARLQIEASAVAEPYASFVSEAVPRPAST
ncbi:hypothetical protein J7E93_34860 [Streptomyces sp. ISL-36]|uniref:hypothetical protein n=1 Tax=Streptomyces sp. ISL-36 TaxID=2819182 RepID=UPI001BE757A3|nr:hypothetical protein [Streptomyces sp. ISL-36]MBT2445175.1 hypothetical protein [Streptomyces sp. ISL-36]